jgi:hypothetical protein
MPNNLSSRRKPEAARHPRMQREAATITAMVRLYCRLQKHQPAADGGPLCEDCAGLLAYANARLEKCPFQEGKTTCAACPVHCYKPEMRARIREVMKTAGPHMLYRHPLLAFQHLVIDSRRKQPLGRVKKDRG